ncbi:hypothetical protein APHAL10511_001961 [Amanita phalloides]|nr:hypothetical protein APHAL10511_001961 [Amanita phalloides]
MFSIHPRKSLTREGSVASLNGALKGESVIDLRGFAYSAAQPPIKVSTTSKRQVSEAQETKTKKRSRMNIALDDSSSNYLAKLTKCVSCNAEWTTKKTATQKMNHIRSCARKKEFTRETLRIALLKEMENIKAMATDETVGEGSDLPENTLLDNMVNAMSTRKRTYRARETVESIAVTRGAILDRAKQILACNAQVTEESKKMDTRDVGSCPLSTQKFNSSALKALCQPKAKLFAEASADYDTRLTCGDDEAEPSRTKASFADIYNENAIVPFDTSGLNDARFFSGTGSHRKLVANKVSCPNKHISRVNGSDQGSVPGQMNVDQLRTGGQWMRQLKYLILQDQDLYLSILRYEPVHYDVFEGLAKSNGLTIPKLKTSLQTFLDQEAIHYYGIEPSGVRGK